MRPAPSPASSPAERTGDRPTRAAAKAQAKVKVRGARKAQARRAALEPLEARALLATIPAPVADADIPVDISGLGVDWVALSGHKLYAPFGSGVLAGRSDWLDAAPPYLAGGGATRGVTGRSGSAAGEVDVEWHTGAARHEAGSPNVIGVHALASACRALTAAGFDALVEREQALLARLREGLARLPRVRVLSLFGEDAPRVGVVSFVVEGWSSSRLAAALSAGYGIGVRDGLFCAHPLVRALTGGQAGSGGCGDDPGGAVRASFGAGTPEEHIDRLLAAVTELCGTP